MGDDEGTAEFSPAGGSRIKYNLRIWLGLGEKRKEKRGAGLFLTTPYGMGRVNEKSTYLRRIVAPASLRRQKGKGKEKKRKGGLVHFREGGSKGNRYYTITTKKKQRITSLNIKVINRSSEREPAAVERRRVRSAYVTGKGSRPNMLAQRRPREILTHTSPTGKKKK